MKKKRNATNAAGLLVLGKTIQYGPRQSTLSNAFGQISFNKMFDDISPSNSGRASGFGESFKILFRYV